MALVKILVKYIIQTKNVAFFYWIVDRVLFAFDPRMFDSKRNIFNLIRRIHVSMIIMTRQSRGALDDYNIIRSDQKSNGPGT